MFIRTQWQEFLARIYEAFIPMHRQKMQRALKFWAVDGGCITCRAIDKTFNKYRNNHV